jgi:hypothetical protein
MPAAPSLLIVPYRSKTGKLYSQIPTSGAGDFTVTRNTEARRFNSAGLIASVASGIPRLDYYTSGGTAGCPALLVEPAATNLCLQSENFLTTWSPTNINVTTGTTAAFTAPDGTTSADLLTASASGSARIIQSFTFVSGTTYSYSAFAKAGSGFFGLTMENGGVASGAAVVWNLNTGALAVSGVVGAGYTLQSQGIENYGNGWYRCRMTVLLGLGVAGNIRANTSDGTMTSAIINSASGNTAYIWGAQLETGSVATSYIPTTAGTASRSADVISVSGAVSGSIGQTEGTMYVEVETRVTAGTAAKRILTISNGNDTGNRISIGKQADDAFIGSILSGGVAQAAITSTTNQSGSFKIALAFAANDAVLYINGTQIGTDTSLGVPSGLNRVDFGQSAANAAQFNDRIRAAALYTTRLTNAELATLTTL